MNTLGMFYPNKLSGALSIGTLALCLFVLPKAALAQAPSDAQTKKDVTGAKTVSVTLGKPGKIEWSSTYKKYMWTRSFTAKLKTETPDIFVIVKGYAAYDVMGGKHVFWRTFTTSNSYEGIANPTQAEIFALIKQLGWQKLMDGHYQSVVGEVESIKLADEPEWVWHTPNSVSFNLELVYHFVQSYTDVEKQRVIYNVRLYRDDVRQPWKNLLTMQTQRTGLESKTYTQKQIGQMPHPARYPFE